MKYTASPLIYGRFCYLTGFYGGKNIGDLPPPSRTGHFEIYTGINRVSGRIDSAPVAYDQPVLILFAPEHLLQKKLI